MTFAQPSAPYQHIIIISIIIIIPTTSRARYSTTNGRQWRSPLTETFSRTSFGSHGTFAPSFDSFVTVRKGALSVTSPDDNTRFSAVPRASLSDRIANEREKSRFRGNVHDSPAERSESKDPLATAARGALTAPRSSSPPLPPLPRYPLPLPARPPPGPCAEPRGTRRPSSRGPELRPHHPSAPSGAPCFSHPHRRLFHPRPHPTLRSSRESFFLASRPSRLPRRCVSRLMPFFYTLNRVLASLPSVFLRSHVVRSRIPRSDTRSTSRPIIRMTLNAFAGSHRVARAIDPKDDVDR